MGHKVPFILSRWPSWGPRSARRLWKNLLFHELSDGIPMQPAMLMATVAIAALCDKPMRWNLYVVAHHAPGTQKSAREVIDESLGTGGFVTGEGANCSELILVTCLALDPSADGPGPREGIAFQYIEPLDPWCANQMVDYELVRVPRAVPGGWMTASLDPDSLRITADEWTLFREWVLKGTAK